MMQVHPAQLYSKTTLQLDCSLLTKPAVNMYGKLELSLSLLKAKLGLPNNLKGNLTKVWLD